MQSSTELSPAPTEDQIDSHKRYYVYSTLSSSMTYTNYVGPATADNDMPTPRARVEVKGGAGVSRPGAERVYTPRGVVTEVNADELRELMNNELFKIHLKNKFVTVEEVEVHPEKVVAKGMEQRDMSSQIVPQDFIGTDPDEVAQPMEGKTSKLNKKPGFIDRLIGAV